jgi:hypothetical protein
LRTQFSRNTINRVGMDGSRQDDEIKNAKSKAEIRLDRGQNRGLRSAA